MIFAQQERVVRWALRTAGFLETSSTVTLQAFVIYLVSCNCGLSFQSIADISRWVQEAAIRMILCLPYPELPYDLHAK